MARCSKFLASAKLKVPSSTTCSRLRCEVLQQISGCQEIYLNNFGQLTLPDSTLCDFWAQVYIYFEGAAMLRAVRSLAMSTMIVTALGQDSTELDSNTTEPVEPPALPVFPCDNQSIHQHAESEHMRGGCADGAKCYAAQDIDHCGADTYCCAPVVGKCTSGATCFATERIEMCEPWASCCAPIVRTCLSPSCSQDFPACTSV
eukprot:s382_g24.t1